MWRENYRRKTITPGHQPNASMSFTSPIRTCVCSLTGGRDISPTSQIHAEVRMKKFWAKHREASEVIELDGLFRNYWCSNDHEFTVLSQSLSPTGSRRSDFEEQRPFSLENVVDL